MLADAKAPTAAAIKVFFIRFLHVLRRRLAAYRQRRFYEAKTLSDPVWRPRQRQSDVAGKPDLNLP
jgi:hypothetical protein